ncbi:DUF502 domain-containing protein [Halobaculum sp. CBA1158]|uniref:DUF502 domain-containing protein n=1 Tax=Halobaculum sp. CBA1158 TaxID=2904243 RepID=UPI001F4373E2|nr:DUF502 domain-containing protein [Halobaculum sp. CBA1158]UIO98604.1 DUF502 domain-containing protein [Halobaculum sp. CBA1158]
MSDWSPREVGGSIADVFRSAFVTGVAVIVPLLISLIVLAVAGQYVYDYLDLFSNYVLGIGPEASYILATPAGPIRFGKERLIEILTPIVLLYSIVVLGLFINATRFGGAAVEYFDAAMAHIPGFGSVYESFRQMSDVMLEEDTQNFRDVKLVEFPHEGAYTLGFVTTETPDALRAPAGHDRMLTLFLPLAPNPVMGGHLVHMPAEKVMDVDMTVEEGIRAVVTSGVAVSGGSTGGESGLSEEHLRSLAGIEHADQKLNPEEGSPDVRRSDGVDADRDHEWDQQVAPERSKTATDIARRMRAQREEVDDETAIPDDEQPYSLYGREEATSTPARESGRYDAETESTDERPAREADRPKAFRDAESIRPEAAGDRDREHRDSDGVVPEEAGGRAEGERESTDTLPAEVTDRSEIIDEDEEEEEDE